MAVEKEITVPTAFLFSADIDQENAVVNTSAEDLSNGNESESFLSTLSSNRFCTLIFFRICRIQYAGSNQRIFLRSSEEE